MNPMAQIHEVNAIDHRAIPL